MRMLIAFLLLQVLTASDPAQMEKAPDLGYRPVPHAFSCPTGMHMGAPSRSRGHQAGPSARLQPRPLPADGIRQGRRIRPLRWAKAVT